MTQAEQNASKPGLQGTIAMIFKVIEQIQPATDKDIERHPEVVAACRSSKLKARRLVARMLKLGHITSDQAQQMPRYRVSKK